MNLKGLLGTVAPWIGTALGGPLGGLAADAAAKVFGLSDKTESAIKMAISGATPDQMLALKKADDDFAVQMQTLGFKEIADLEKIAADDRDSARKMEVATHDWTPTFLALLVVVAWNYVQFYLLQHVLETTMREIILRMQGNLDAALMVVLNYYFGSSSSSRLKDQTIAGMVDK
jgi:hypothetical protein